MVNERILFVVAGVFESVFTFVAQRVVVAVEKQYGKEGIEPDFGGVVGEVGEDEGEGGEEER